MPRTIVETFTTTYPVTRCSYCQLPTCEHSRCINAGECPKADITHCSCYHLYDIRTKPRNQSLIGKMTGKRKVA